MNCEIHQEIYEYILRYLVHSNNFDNSFQRDKNE